MLNGLHGVISQKLILFKKSYVRNVSVKAVEREKNNNTQLIKITHIYVCGS
jgi:hypothetical protein